MLHNYGTIRHILTYFTLLIYPTLVFTGVTNFEAIESIVYAQTGDTAKLGWVYNIGNKGLDFTSNENPTWSKIYPNGTIRKLMYDNGNRNWEFEIAPDCPTAYKTRISKEGNATLVISNVTQQDSGNYSCKLQLTVGIKTKDIKLVVSDPPPTTTSPPSHSLSPSLTPTNTTNGEKKPPKSQDGMNDGAIAGCVIGGLIGIGLIIGVGVYFYKKKKSSSSRD